MERLLVINRLLSQPDGLNRNMETLLNEMKLFVECFGSPLIECPQESQELRPLLVSLESDIPNEIEIYIAKMLKILLRNQLNRRSLGKPGILSIIRSLCRHSRNVRGIATGEIGNVALNSCYNGENVDLFIELGGIEPLCMLLMVNDPNIIPCILGAIQGICYVPAGRIIIRRNFQILERISELLNSTDEIIRARAVGCIHNISADSVSISMLREANSIPSLIQMLREHSPEICQAAAGTLQNLSREVTARNLILAGNATPLLLDLLFSNDPKCQIASIGAILNLLGPTLDGERLELLRETLTNGLVLGIIESCIFEP